MKYLKYVALVFIILSLSACKESNVTETKKETGDINLLSSFTYGSVIQNFMSSSVGPIHAIQHGGLKLPVTNNYTSYTGSSKFYNGAIYSDGTSAVQLNNVTCETNPVTLDVGYLPLKYFDYWAINTGPNPGDMIDWTFDYNGVTVNTHCPLPSDFGTVSISSGTNPLDMSVGGTLNWGNTGSEDVILTFTYYTYDSTKQDITHSRIVESTLVPNSGSFSITPSILSDWGVPSDATYLDVHLIKANYVIDHYDNNTKQVLTISTVETHFAFSLK